MTKDWIGTEQRKGQRFQVVVPVELRWDEAGRIVTETAEASNVNMFGGLLNIKACPRVGSEVSLTNLLSSETTDALVADIRRATDGSIVGVTVAFVVPSESFWGVNSQLRKISAELTSIEEAIKSDGVDTRILRDFRDAVDYIRKTAWAVQEGQERQLLKRDPQTLVPLITFERIRRATQLHKAIMEDLDTHEVTSETAGMQDLFQSIERLYQHVAESFGDQRPSV